MSFLNWFQPFNGNFCLLSLRFQCFFFILVFVSISLHFCLSIFVPHAHMYTHVCTHIHAHRCIKFPNLSYLGVESSLLCVGREQQREETYSDVESGFLLSFIESSMSCRDFLESQGHGWTSTGTRDRPE